MNITRYTRRKAFLNWRIHPEIGQAVIAEHGYRKFEILWMGDSWYARDATPQPLYVYEDGLAGGNFPTLAEAVDYVETSLPKMREALPRIEIAAFLESRNGLS